MAFFRNRVLSHLLLRIESVCGVSDKTECYLVALLAYIEYICTPTDGRDITVATLNLLKNGDLVCCSSGGSKAHAAVIKRATPSNTSL